MTVSADSIVKLCEWIYITARNVFSKANSGDVEASKLVTSWSLGPGVDNQQVGGTWIDGDEIVSLSMSSDLNIFDKRVSGKPSRIIQVGYIPWVSCLRCNAASLGPPKSGNRCSSNRFGNILDRYRQWKGVVFLCYWRGISRWW